MMEQMPPQCIGDPRDLEAAYQWKMGTAICATSEIRFSDWQRLVDAFQAHREAAEKHQDRIASELQAAQGIAVHELGRQRELAAARLRTIKGLNAKLKSTSTKEKA